MSASSAVGVINNSETNMKSSLFFRISQILLLSISATIRLSAMTHRALTLPCSMAFMVLGIWQNPALFIRGYSLAPNRFSLTAAGGFTPPNIR